MRCSNVSRGQNGDATRGDGTKLVVAWGPPGEHMPSVAQCLLSYGHGCHEGMQVSRGQLHEISSRRSGSSDVCTKACWLVNVDCSLISLSFKYDVAKAARALLHNLCFGLSAGRHNFLPPAFPLAERCDRQALLCTKKRSEAWGLGECTETESFREKPTIPNLTFYPASNRAMF